MKFEIFSRIIIFFESLFRCCFCFSSSKVSPEIKKAVYLNKEEEQVWYFIEKGIKLNLHQRKIFECRILPVLYQYRKKLKYTKYSYFISRWSLQTSSLLIPALLGINLDLFWVIWSLSLFVGMMTNLVHMFRWDRQYYLLHRTYQLLLSEIWYFAEKINGYEMYSFENFCERFEKIRHSYEEDENIVIKDSSSYLPSTNGIDANFRELGMKEQENITYDNPIQIPLQQDMNFSNRFPDAIQISPFEVSS